MQRFRFPLAWMIQVAVITTCIPMAAMADQSEKVIRPMEEWEKKVWQEERIPADHWIPGLEYLDGLLRAGDYQAAEFEARDLIHQMVEFDVGREEDATYLAKAVTLRALAQAGLGEEENALWTWYTAQNLGGYGKVDLDLYGEPGELLKANLLRDYEPPADLVDVIDPGGTLQELTPPGRLKTVYPVRPKAFRESKNDLIFSEIVFVQGVIDHQGKLQRPVVVDTGGYPTLIYSAFEALSHFRFSPARLDGKAVPVLHVVPVTFSDDRPVEYSDEWIEMGAGGEAVGHRGSIGEGEPAG